MPDASARALRTARSATEQNPNSAKAWFALGMSILRSCKLYNQKELAKAYHALRRAVRFRESEKLPCPDYRFNLAILNRLRLDFQQAYEQFRQAQIEDPGLQDAGKRANELETLLASACGRVQGRMLDLNAICQPEKGIFGLQLGKNNFQIAFRILSRFDSQVP